MSALQLAGVIIGVGSIFFLNAAFLPLSRVYAEPDPAEKLKMIKESERGWPTSQFLFGLGAIVTAVGVGLWSAEMGDWLAYCCFLAFLLGACFWCWHLYLRTRDPEAFTAGTLPAWHFRAYTFLTQLGLVLLGLFLIMLLGSRVPGWVGWLNLVGSGLLFAAYLLFKDMPPFVYYLLTLVTGIMFYLAG